MRSLKFRAWGNLEKRYWYDLLNNGRGSDPACDGLIDYLEDEDCEVEQYTGLKDKNGKEIYEGDIFRNNINGGIWRIYWNEEDAGFWVDSGVSGCSLGDFDWSRDNREWGFIKKNCEVIGTIHENPELLNPCNPTDLEPLGGEE